MGALTKLDPIPLPDTRRPDRTPSWPAWVGSRVDAMKAEAQPDPRTGRYRSVMTLPQSLTLSPSERTVIERHVAAVKMLLAQTPENGGTLPIEGKAVDCHDAMLAVITKMMLALPSARASETGVEATGEAYMTALEDVPVWAAAAALRHWYRGESAVLDPKQPHDFRWRPAPAVLRRLALKERFPLHARVLQLEQVLAAETLIEFTPEHEEMMKKAVSGLIRAMSESAITPEFTIADAIAFASKAPQEQAPALPEKVKTIEPLQHVKTGPVSEEAA